MDLNDYVHELRETQQITTKQLSFGLCAASTLRNDGNLTHEKWCHPAMGSTM